MSLPVEPSKKIRTGAGAHIGRRTFLWLVGAGAATAATAGTAFWFRERREPPVLAGAIKPASIATGSSAAQNVVIALTASPATVPLYAGNPTQVWKYTGKVLQGDPGSLQEVPGSYLGPTLRLHKGQKVRIELTNGLPEETIIHWHGLLLPAGMDGHPRDVIAPGERFVYEFEVANRAGTYWYHPHPDGQTGSQVNQGLAGFLLVSDEEEASLGLPTGEQDVPLVLQDRRVDGDNQFTYIVRGMMDHGGGFLGDHILVNGQPEFVLNVATRAYRLRLLNGSNSRIYKLAWSNGVPLTVIGTDGGLLGAPVTRDYVMLAPGERIELLADFSSYPLNTKLELRSLEFSGSSGGEMGGMGAEQQGLPDGIPFSVLTVQVARKENGAFVVPKNLAVVAVPRVQDAVNAAAPRQFTLTRGHGKWLINERSFGLNEVADDETVAFSVLETWEFINDAGSGGMGGRGMMGSMPHPMHIHGVQFRVIGREVTPESTSQWQTVGSGFVDEGWKDTVLVMPGETVKLLLRFEKYPGVFVYHCHNLEHEDMGMMRNYRIRA